MEKIMVYFLICDKMFMGWWIRNKQYLCIKK